METKSRRFIFLIFILPVLLSNYSLAQTQYGDHNRAIKSVFNGLSDAGGTLPDEPHTFPVAVFQKIGDEWKIVMFHNMMNRIKEIEERRKKGDMGDVRH